MKKFTSRKFLMSLLADIIGIVGIVASENGNDIQIIASIILIIVGTVTYILGEAKVDAAAVVTNVGLSLSEIIKLIETIKSNDDPLISSIEEELEKTENDTENDKEEA